MSTGPEIRLIEEEDGWWSAIDEETGSQVIGSCVIIFRTGYQFW
jgi:hypothetical protein